MEYENKEIRIKKKKKKQRKQRAKCSLLCAVPTTGRSRAPPSPSPIQLRLTRRRRRLHRRRFLNNDGVQTALDLSPFSDGDEEGQDRDHQVLMKLVGADGTRQMMVA
ncbi:hypothetical protein E1A91_A06G000200v1 [Gossypium mustelinum]|uniref:Uncharacterized protein n=1 Tax=Gossypium mustelinum TaxID=34275 RepID=A0A5D2YQR3_GOSMU|nr:hypothetical protein E1A91_A06G000200v1 [Gossypium mustelinum]